MEPHFQTSFIPKRPLAPVGAATGLQVATKQHRTGASIYMTLAVLIFIASLAGVGGAFAWKQYLASTQEGYKQNLAKREQQFNLDLIEQLKQINVKIDTVRTLLNTHLALSSLFDILGRFTIAHVRFLSLDVTGPTTPNSSDIKIAMHGYGTSLQAVAFQSDVLSQLEQYGLRKMVKNPIISDPSLATDGTVAFGFSASIDSSSLSYENSVTGAAGTTGTTPSGTTQ